MNSFYTVIGYLKDTLLADPDVNTVRHGEFMEGKKDVYPFAHILVTGAGFAQGIVVFNFTVHVLDQRNVSKEPITDKFLGNDNELDNLNTCFSVVNKLVTRLKLQYNEFDIELLNEPTPQPVEFQFKETLDGWVVDLQFSIPNNIDVC